MQSRNLYCVQLQSKLVTVHTRYARSLLLCPPHFADGVAQRGDYSDAEAWSPPPPWVASVALSIDVPGGGRTAPWSVPLLNVDHIIVTDGLGNERVLRDGEAVQLSPSFVLSIQFEEHIVRLGPASFFTGPEPSLPEEGQLLAGSGRAQQVSGAAPPPEMSTPSRGAVPPASPITRGADDGDDPLLAEAVADMAPAPPARAELDFKIPRSAFVYYVLEDIAGDDLKGTLAEPAAYEMVATERRLDHDGGWAPLAGGWRRQPVSLRIVRRRHGPAVLLTALGVDGGDEKLRDMRIVPVEAPVLSFKKVIYETVAADEGEQRECIFLLDINATMQLEALQQSDAKPRIAALKKDGLEGGAASFIAVPPQAFSLREGAELKVWLGDGVAAPKGYAAEVNKGGGAKHGKRFVLLRGTGVGGELRLRVEREKGIDRWKGFHGAWFTVVPPLLQGAAVDGGKVALAPRLLTEADQSRLPALHSTIIARHRFDRWEGRLLQELTASKVTLDRAADFVLSLRREVAHGFSLMSNAGGVPPGLLSALRRQLHAAGYQLGRGSCVLTSAASASEVLQVGASRDHFDIGELVASYGS
mmetsp:Transcript_18070/g.52364  ORF Transcript_18070/g.52364 Transcript_18070/m.52364 type:complete len:586 (-) Transcript_18070:119-1876(-)